VLHGIRSFLPHIRAHGEGGHIVNTASMAGMEGGLGFSPYAASKFAVVSMSEGLSPQLKPFGIGVSVPCPSFVRTRIGESGRNRPERNCQSQPLDPASPAAAMVAGIARQIEAGLDPATVAARVLEAIRQESSTFSPMPACGPRSSRDLPSFWPRWTRFRPLDPARVGLMTLFPELKRR
jgi:NAD(P)-dependent dehydrogenase (short-subunit alcohol dehydrogenase family)